MFALINPDLTDTGKRRAFIPSPGPVPGHPHKPYWVPIEVEVDDTSTGPDRVVSAWVETVEAARLLRSRTIRDKTAAELAAEDTAQVGRLLADSGIDRALARMIFNINNRVRSIEGGGPLSVAQFKAALRGLMR